MPSPFYIGGESGSEDPYSEILNLYRTREGNPYTSMLEEHIKKTPVYEDFRPGFVQKLIAGLSAGVEGAQKGLGAGLKLGSNMLEQGYMRALKEHEMKGSNLEQLARIHGEEDSSYARMLRDSLSLIDKKEDNKRMDARYAQLADEASKRQGLQEQEHERKKKRDSNTVRWQNIRAGIMGRNVATRERAQSYRESHPSNDPERQIPQGNVRLANDRAIDQSIATNPDYEKFIIRDYSKRIIGMNPEETSKDPEKFGQFMDEVEGLSTTMLQGTYKTPSPFGRKPKGKAPQASMTERFSFER